MRNTWNWKTRRMAKKCHPLDSIQAWQSLIYLRSVIIGLHVTGFINNQPRNCDGALGSTSLTAELLAIHRFCQMIFTLVYALLNWAGLTELQTHGQINDAVGQKGKWIYVNPRERLVKSRWTGALGTQKKMEMHSCLACIMYTCEIKDKYNF